ncbi:hypothetical protein CF597_02910 [Pseudomonas sp. PSB1]|nr:hypothetical protein [Pseudomonas sp. PSB1]
MRVVEFLWRGSLLPLGCAAAPFFAIAAQSSGSKLPRHKSTQRTALTPSRVENEVSLAVSRKSRM